MNPPDVFELAREGEFTRAFSPDAAEASALPGNNLLQHAIRWAKTLVVSTSTPSPLPPEEAISLKHFIRDWRVDPPIVPVEIQL